jgi:hypothetical protein
MTNFVHMKIVCYRCGSIISQCRCMSCDKFTKYSLCDKCEERGNDVIKFDVQDGKIIQ